MEMDADRIKIWPGFGLKDADRVKIIPRKPRRIVICNRKNKLYLEPLNLSDFTLHVQRAHDLLDLKFEIDGYSLKFYPRFHRLIEDPKVPASKRQLRILFPPQHTPEEAFYSDPCRVPIMSDHFASGTSRIVFSLPNKNKWGKSRLTLRQLMDWENLTQKVNLRAVPFQATIEHQLSVAKLFEAEIRDERTKRNETTEEASSVRQGDRLRVESITEIIRQNNKISEYKAGIRSTIKVSPKRVIENSISQIKSDQFKSPSTDETAVEIWNKFLISPGRDTKWEQWGNENSDSDDQSVTISRVRPDQKGRGSSRILWSRKLKDGEITFTDSTPPQKPKQNDGKCEISDDAKFDLLNSKRDHQEMVLQSSIYGLGGLRREMEHNHPGDESTQTLDLPRAQVLRPPHQQAKMLIEALDQLMSPDSGGENLKGQTGIYFPAPLKKANYFLSSQGGIIDTEWTGEPPILLPNNARYTIRGEEIAEKYRLGALDIQGVEMVTYLGRDVREVVERKGYLLPLGVRATFITQDVREIFKVGNSHVSAPIRRRFIELFNLEKKYRVNLPFQGRGIGFDSVKFVTKRTPEIKPPAPPDALSDFRDDEGNVLAFWPNLASNSEEVSFEFTLNGETYPVTMNMLWVSNRLMSEPAKMEQVAKYYRDLGKEELDWHDLRTALVGHARHRFAPSRVDGDTAFPCKRILFSLQGRGDAHPLSPDHTGEFFEMDSRMEGQDQPPFYPFMERIDINVPALDRLTGTAPETVEMRFDQLYLDKGFPNAPKTESGDTPPDDTKSIDNKFEVYLVPTTQAISLNFGKQTNSSGGIASPSIVFGGLSRSKGIIGGKPISKLINSQDNSGENIKLQNLGRRQSLSKSRSSNDYSVDISDALGGTFNPKKFFDESAKLLGIINISELFEQLLDEYMPELLEETIYALGIDKRIKQLAKKIADLIDDFEENIKEALERLRVAGQTYTMEILYPELNRDLNDLKSALRELEDIPDTDSDKEKNYLEVSRNILEPAKRLQGTLKDIVKDPVPKIIEEGIEGFIQSWKEIGDLLTKDIQTFVKNLVISEVCDPIDDFLFSKIDSTYKEILFGSAEFSLAGVVRDPSSFSPNDTWLENSFSQALIDLEVATRETKAFKDIASLLDQIGNFVQILFESSLDFIFAEAFKACDSIAALSNAAFEFVASEVVHNTTPLTIPDYSEFFTVLEKLGETSSTIAIKRSIAKIENEYRSVLRQINSNTETRCDQTPKVLKTLNNIYNSGKSVQTELEAINNTLKNIDLSSMDERLRDQFIKELRIEFIKVIKKSTPIKYVEAQVGRAEQLGVSLINAARIENRDLRLKLISLAKGLSTEIKSVLNSDASFEEIETALKSLKDLKRFEKEIAGQIFQLLIFENEVVSQLCEDFEKKLIQVIPAVSKRLRSNFQGFADEFSKLNNIVNAAISNPWVAILLSDVSKKSISNINVASQSLLKTLQGLEGLSTKPSRACDFATLKLHIEQSQRVPGDLKNLTNELKNLEQVADNIISGNFEFLFNANLTEELEEELKNLLLEFIPTRHSLKYEFKANVKSPNKIFSIETMPKPNFVLTANITSDFKNVISGNNGGKPEITSEVSGYLAESEVKLLPDFDIATITLTEMKFGSVNGGSFDFDVAVAEVKMGEHMKFLEPLQAWMSGGDETGLYYDISLSGIEVGYRFGVDMIAMGAVNFYNINFSVSANLPFNGAPASFVFEFARPDLPFLISSPPYGGGGSVALTASPKGIVGFELLFVFGAVAAIKFGPLRGHGHILVGMYINRHKVGDHQVTTLIGLVEAYAEGSVGCFSVSLLIRVSLIHRTGGSVEGSAVYRLKFKVAFAKITFKFRARYQFKKGSSKNDKRVRYDPKDTVEDSPGFVSAVNLTSKREKPKEEAYSERITEILPRIEQWTSYARTMDISLIDRMIHD